MSGQPAFKILGGELLCGINTYDDTISYLTNQQIQDYINNYGKQEKSFIPDQARLRSPSYIKKVKLETLIDFERHKVKQKQSLESPTEILPAEILTGDDLDSLGLIESEQLKLYSDPQSMIFFRTESYIFPKVQFFPTL